MAGQAAQVGDSMVCMISVGSGLTGVLPPPGHGPGWLRAGDRVPDRKASLVGLHIKGVLSWELSLSLGFKNPAGTGPKM